MVKEKCSTDSSPLLIFHQNICGLKEKKDKLYFSEHHLKQIELEHTNLEGYKLGAAYCRKSLLKRWVCIFVHKKYNYSNVDLGNYCKEQNIEACALKLELTALNIYVVTVYRAPWGNFSSFLNGLASIIKSLYEVKLQLIICDINIDYLTDNGRKNSLTLCYCPII
jgi:hypothetical protein